MQPIHTSDTVGVNTEHVVRQRLKCGKEQYGFLVREAEPPPDRRSRCLSPLLEQLDSYFSDAQQSL